MKNFSYILLLLAFFVALSVQTNDHCSGAVSLPIPTTHKQLSLLDLHLSLLDILSLDLSLFDGSSCGAWYVLNNLNANLALELNVCALDSTIDVDVAIYEGSCNSLRQIDTHSDCCGIDVNLDVEIGHTYYILVLADVEIDCLLDLHVLL